MDTRGPGRTKRPAPRFSYLQFLIYMYLKTYRLVSPSIVHVSSYLSELPPCLITSPSDGDLSHHDAYSNLTKVFIVLYYFLGRSAEDDQAEPTARSRAMLTETLNSLRPNGHGQCSQCPFNTASLLCLGLLQSCAGYRYKRYRLSPR